MSLMINDGAREQRQQLLWFCYYFVVGNGRRLWIHVMQLLFLMT